MDTLVSHRLIYSNSRLKTVLVGTATRSFPLLQTPVLERDFLRLDVYLYGTRCLVILYVQQPSARSNMD